MKQPNGTVLYLAHRNVYVGYWDGKIQCTKKGPAQCKDFLNAKFGSDTTVLGKVPAPMSGFMARNKAKFDHSVNLNGTRHKLVSQVADEWTKARVFYPSLPVEAPKVEFYSRGKHAGKAYRYGHRVAFNEVLASENPDTFLNTVKHELAHIVVFAKYPFAKPHGYEFKHVFVTLGGNGKRTHNYSVETIARKSTRYVYACGCREMNISTVRHRRASSGMSYFCKLCKTSIKYTGKVVRA